MAINPQLTRLSTGEAFPAPFNGEYFALARGGIVLDLKDIPAGVPGLGSKWRGAGKLVLSSVRAVFIADKQDGVLAGFDMPLVYVRRHKFNQPILGCNNITGECWSTMDEAGPNGELPPIQFKIEFARGGVGTFLPLYRLYLARSHEGEKKGAVKESSPAELLATAMVDPNDPSVVYLAQPVPSAPPIAAPKYHKLD